MRRPVTAAVLAAALSAGAVAAASAPVVADPTASPFPSAIALPDGFFPEGIAMAGRTAYVGSLIDGAIVQQNIKTGQTEPFVGSPGPGKIAVGMDVDDHGRLWVAGGGPGLDPSLSPGFRVYDTATGALLADVTLPGGGFVNDVVVVDDAAWLTDSFAPQLVRVPLGAGGAIGAAESVPLVGDWQQAAGFNANGIVATADGGHLVVAQSTAPDVAGSALYAVPADATAAELEAVRIELDDTLAGADGLVLIGRTLYSVAGAPGVVEVKLSQSLTRGRVGDTTPVPDSVTPTTAAAFGSSLYVVDAKFSVFGDPTVSFQTTVIPR